MIMAMLERRVAENLSIRLQRHFVPETGNTVFTVQKVRNSHTKNEQVVDDKALTGEELAMLIEFGPLSRGGIG